MKEFSDCLESIQNGEHDKYPYTVTMLEHIDADIVEGMLRAICQAVEYGSSVDARLFAQSLGTEINAAMLKRAESMSKASVTPFDNDTNESDVRREL